MKLKTRKPTFQFRDPLVLEKQPASTRMHFKGSNVFPEKVEFLTKAKKWRECPLVRFPEFTRERLGREGSSIQKSGIGTEKCGVRRTGRLHD